MVRGNSWSIEIGAGGKGGMGGNRRSIWRKAGESDSVPAEKSQVNMGTSAYVSTLVKIIIIRSI